LSISSGAVEQMTDFRRQMGLALRGLVTSPVELNLLREEVNRHTERKALRLYGGGSLLLILGMMGIMVQASRSEYQKKANYLEEIKETIKTYQSYEPKIKELELKNQLLRNQVSSLYGVLRQRQTWLDVLQRLEKFLPKEVWLMSYDGTLDLTAGSQNATAGIVRIVGRSLSYQGVTEFVSNLKNSVQFTQVKPVSSNIKKSETGDEIVEFQVEMKIAWQ
jgi:Tfp pilus assembly protein PilN